MAEITHHSVKTNGISMHVAEAGSGFPVVFCHGWPELWYSWRHQIAALADAGFRAIAPDMRGYGGTDAPADPAEYTMKTLSADMVGLLDALDIDKAVFVGHDWGGAVIWQMGLRYPERVERLVGLNTPYAPPSNARTTESLRDFHGQTDKTFYMRYFLQPGVAEAELEADIPTTFKKIFLPYTRAEDFTAFMTVGGDGSGVLTKIQNTNSIPHSRRTCRIRQRLLEDRLPRRPQLVPRRRPQCRRSRRPDRPTTEHQVDDGHRRQGHHPQAR